MGPSLSYTEILSMNQTFKDRGKGHVVLNMKMGLLGRECSSMVEYFCLTCARLWIDWFPNTLTHTKVYSVNMDGIKMLNKKKLEKL